MQGNAGTETQAGGEFRAGFHKCLAIWTLGGLGKCCPPALTPPETFLSDSISLLAISSADKSSKLLPLIWVSAGLIEHAISHM